MGGTGLPWPLSGQGLPPPGPAPTAVTFDCVVDNMRSINSKENSYTAVHWLHLSWEDPRAADIIDASTEAWLAAFNTTNPMAESGCARPCDSSGHPGAGCCSNIFVPHIELPNLVYISQESVYRYRIWVDPSNPRIIHWSSRVSAVWHSPFDFRAWPFEHQHLLLEAMVSPSIANKVYLVLGHASFIQNSPHTKGDAVPGWHVAKITRRVYKNSACFASANATTSIYEVASDMQHVALNPMSPASWAQLSAVQAASVKNTTADHATCEGVSPGGFYPEAMALYGPQQLVVDIMMKRTQAYYVLSSVVPLLILDYMVFITYAMERSDLEARMGVVVTLVLSVSALQFTYDFPPASYLNAVQQITLTSYVLFFIVALESMIASHICRLHARKRAHAQLMAAAAGHPAMSGAHARSFPHGLPTIRASFDSYSGPGPLTAAGRKSGGPVPQPSIRTPSPATLNRANTQSTMDVTVTPVSYSELSKGGAHDVKQLQLDMPDGMMDPQPSQSYPVPRSSVDTYDAVANNRAFDPGYQASIRPRVNGARGVPGPVAEAIHSPFENSEPPSPTGRNFAMDGRRMDTGRRYPVQPASGDNQHQLRHRTAARSSFTRAFCCNSDPEDQQPQGHQAMAYTYPIGGSETEARAAPAKRKGTALSRALTRTFSRVTNKIPKKIDADEAYAQLFASRLDMWFSWSLLLSFTVVVAVLLYINTQVGDHKLMMGNDAPANM